MYLFFMVPAPFSGLQRVCHVQCPPKLLPGYPRSLVVGPLHLVTTVLEYVGRHVLPVSHSPSLPGWSHHESGVPEPVSPSLQRPPPPPWLPSHLLQQTSAAATSQVCLLPEGNILVTMAHVIPALIWLFTTHCLATQLELRCILCLHVWNNLAVSVSAVKDFEISIFTGLMQLLYAAAVTKINIASYQGPFEKSEKRAWYPLFAHALN